MPMSRFTTEETLTSTVSSLGWERRCTVRFLAQNTVSSTMESNITLAYMSHFDKLVKLPAGFEVIASTQNSEFAGIAHQTKPIYGTPRPTSVFVFQASS